MGIDWTTFLLEAVNFAILVWILQRFLYRPVLRIVRERRSAIEAEMEGARKLRAEADALLASGRSAQQAWERERESRLERLAEDMQRERTRRQEELEAALELEREKARAVETRRLEEQARQAERRALEQAAGFAARLLEALAGPEMEQRLTRLFLDQIGALPAERVQSIRATLPEGEDLLPRVLSAYVLEPEQRERITRALWTMLGQEVPVRFEERADLFAGLQVHLGYWVLGANLRDELKYFAETSPHAS